MKSFVWYIYYYKYICINKILYINNKYLKKSNGGYVYIYRKKLLKMLIFIKFNEMIVSML